MDPFTALGVVSSVISIVDLSTKLLSATQRAYSAAKGASEELNDLGFLVTGLEHGLHRLEYQAGQTHVQHAHTSLKDDDEKQLREISKACSDLAKRLLDKVKPFTAQNPNSRRSRIKAMVSCLKDRMTHETEKLRERLDQYQQQLETHIIISVRKQVSKQSMQSAAFYERFDQREQHIINKLDQGMNHISDILSSAVQSLKDSTQNVVVQDGNQTRKLILAHMDKAKIDHVRRIHASLWFRGAGKRYDEVELAHSGTYDWLLTNSPDQKSPSLASWLRGDDVQLVYWIAGKPGAGKSTAMKKVARSPIAKQLLDQWASSSAGICVVANHFFWYSGDAEQKKQSGMLRSLLHQALKVLECHQSAVLGSLESELGVISSDGMIDWYPQRIINLFELLFAIPDTSFCLLLLIDGLDECSDDHAQLMKTIQHLTHIGNGRLRVLCASRPWAVFVESLARSQLAQTIFLHDFTVSDIHRYVMDELYQSSVFQSLAELAPEEGEGLITYITEKAQGVFIWVQLVVQQLRKCLRTGPVSIKSLLGVTRKMPAELVDLYDHIVLRSETDLRKDGSTLLLLHQVLNEKHSFFPQTPWEFYVTLLVLKGQISTQDLSILTKSENDDNVSYSVQEIIYEATGGLLEVKTYHNESSVIGLHRTVHDWLNLPRTRNKLDTWAHISREKLFHAVFETCLLFIYNRNLRQRGSEDGSIVDVLDVFLLRGSLETLLLLDGPTLTEFDRLSHAIHLGYQAWRLVCEASSGEQWTGFSENINPWLHLAWHMVGLSLEQRIDFARLPKELDDFRTGGEGAHSRSMFFMLCPQLSGRMIHKEQMDKLLKLTGGNHLPKTCGFAIAALHIAAAVPLSGPYEYHIYGLLSSTITRSLKQGFDPVFSLLGSGCNLWQAWLLYLDRWLQVIIKPRHAHYHIAKITTLFRNNGAAKIQDTEFPSRRPCPSAPVPRAHEYLTPCTLQFLQLLPGSRQMDFDPYDGPIPTHAEWVIVAETWGIDHPEWYVPGMELVQEQSLAGEEVLILVLRE